MSPSSSSSTSHRLFGRIVQLLRQRNETLTVIESSTGGLINAHILGQPGASKVYVGGSIAYSTAKAKPFLLPHTELQSKLLKIHPSQQEPSTMDPAQVYIQSKFAWTKEAAIAFCDDVNTTYCLAQAGATGPTFPYDSLTTGFSVVAIAQQQQQPSEAVPQMINQQLFYSQHANRWENMELACQQAGELFLEQLEDGEPQSIHAIDMSRKHSSHQEQVTITLDRAIHLRSNSVELKRLEPLAQYVVLYKNWTLFDMQGDRCDGEPRSLALFSYDQLQALQGKMPTVKWQTSFLGLVGEEQKAVFGVDFSFATLDGENDSKFKDVLYDIAQESSKAVILEDTRTVAPLLSTDHNELVLHATALAQWQRRSHFCSICGSPADLIDAGTSRKCSSPTCGQQSWPRQDPSMIVAVSSRCGERILLARSPRHPKGMHTALAGFIEVGESMEAAVAREVMEETGIRIDEASVKYVASQPWPFPQSTMIGFLATADEQQELAIDEDELVEAGWFNREQVRAATNIPGPVMQHEVAKAALLDNPHLELLIPPRGVLARTLVETWLEQGESA